MVCTRSSSQALFQLLDSPRKKHLLISMVKKNNIKPKAPQTTIPASFRALKRFSTSASPSKPCRPASVVHANELPPAPAPIYPAVVIAAPVVPVAVVQEFVVVPDANQEGEPEALPGGVAVVDEDFMPAVQNPPAPLNFVASGQHLRDLLQLKWLAREAVDKLGEAGVNDLLSAIKCPIPTVKRIFMEELHNKWIAERDFGKFEIRGDGTFIRAVGFVDDAIVRTEELNQMMWVPTYPNLENVLQVQDYINE